MDAALRIRQEEQLPVYERLGDVRNLLITQAKIAIILLQQQPPDQQQAAHLLSLAWQAAQRLRIPEAAQILDIMRDYALPLPEE